MHIGNKFNSVAIAISGTAIFGEGVTATAGCGFNEMSGYTDYTVDLRSAGGTGVVSVYADAGNGYTLLFAQPSNTNYVYTIPGTACLKLINNAVEIVNAIVTVS